MENSNRQRQQLLRRALQVNASFSTISGLVLVFAPQRGVVRLLGLPETINLMALGIGLLVFAVILVFFSRKKPIKLFGRLDRSYPGRRVGSRKLPASLCGAL